MKTLIYKKKEYVMSKQLKQGERLQGKRQKA